MPSLLACCDFYSWEADEWFALWIACAGGRVAMWLTDEEDEVLLVVSGDAAERAAPEAL